MDKVEKIEYFLEYNKDNIFTNLLQAEDHLKKLNTPADVEFAQCAVKHLAMVEGEANEAVAHSLELGKPREAEVYREIERDAKKLRRKIKAGADPNELVLEVRRIRKKFEKLNPAYDTSQCRACGEVEEVLNLIRSKIKHLNRKKRINHH